MESLDWVIFRKAMGSDLNLNHALIGISAVMFLLIEKMSSLCLSAHSHPFENDLMN